MKKNMTLPSRDGVDYQAIVGLPDDMTELTVKERATDQ